MIKHKIFLTIPSSVSVDLRMTLGVDSDLLHTMFCTIVLYNGMHLRLSNANNGYLLTYPITYSLTNVLIYLLTFSMNFFPPDWALDGVCCKTSTRREFYISAEICWQGPSQDDGTQAVITWRVVWVSTSATRLDQWQHPFRSVRMNEFARNCKNSQLCSPPIS